MIGKIFSVAIDLLSFLIELFFLRVAIGIIVDGHFFIGLSIIIMAVYAISGSMNSIRKSLGMKGGKNNHGNSNRKKGL